MRLHLTLLAAALPCLAFAAPASQGLLVTAPPYASGDRVRLQVELTDAAAQQSLQGSAGSPSSALRASASNGSFTAQKVTSLAAAAQGGASVLAFDQSGSFAPYWAKSIQLARTWAAAQPGIGARTLHFFAFGKTRVDCGLAPGEDATTCLSRFETLRASQSITRLKSYIQDAVRHASQRKPLASGGSREVIVFTDAGDESTTLTVDALAEEAHSLGVRVHVVCFAGAARSTAQATRLDDMKKLALATGGRYLQVEDLPNPEAELRALAQSSANLFELEFSTCGAPSSAQADTLNLDVGPSGQRLAWAKDLPFKHAGHPDAAKACPAPAAAPEPAAATAPQQPGTTPPAKGSIWPYLVIGALLLAGLIAWALRRANKTPEVPVAPLAPAPPPPAALEAPPPPVAAAPTVADPLVQGLPETHLRLVSAPPGGNVLAVYRIHKSPFTVGTEAGSDLRLSVGQVSSTHARLELFKAGKVFITDLGSTNGTYVDGLQLTPQQRRPLQPGDRVSFSRQVTFVLEQPAAGATPQPQVQAAAAGAPADGRLSPRTVFSPAGTPAAGSNAAKGSNEDGNARPSAKTIFSPAGDKK
jgi:hypothetical protein